MKLDLDKQLCDKYPKIFRDRHAPMTETCMCWGLEVGEGWYNILDNACWLIQKYIDRTIESRNTAMQFNQALKEFKKSGDLGRLEEFYTIGEIISDWGRKAALEASNRREFRDVPEACPQFIATQVKEKFGTLSFYHEGGDHYTDGVISMAEAMSGVTCDVCGAPGTLEGQGWVTCRCIEHK